MAVKLSSIKADIERETKGDWVDSIDIPGVAFNVSSLHLPAFQIDLGLLTQRLARQYKGRDAPDVRTVEVGKLLHKHILHDWRGFDVPYSKEVAKEYLCELEGRNFIAAVQNCAASLSMTEFEFVEDAEKLREGFRDWMRRKSLPEGSQDWLEDIADAYPDEEWVQKAAYPDGRYDYQPEPWHTLYWEAWNTLQFDRPYGAMGGEGPIPYMVISRYAEDHGIAGEDFWFFRKFMDVLDAEWLRYVRERSERDKKEERRMSEHG